MAVVMQMEWPGVTAEQYDALRGIVNWENDPATGGMTCRQRNDHVGSP